MNNIYSNLIMLGSVAIGLSAYLSFQIPNRTVSLFMTVLSSIFTLLITYMITRKWLDRENEAKTKILKDKYEKKILRLKKEYDTTTLEKTIRDGTQTLIKNAVDYFKIENIKNEMGPTAAIQNLQLDKYGEIIELLADFSLILPDYKENQSIVQEEINHQIEIYQIDEKAFAIFLQRILEKYQLTVNKKIREKVELKILEQKKACPRCAEKVLFKAKICKHCGYEFKDRTQKSGAKRGSLALEKVEKGRDLFKQGQLQEALTEFSNAIKIKPNYALAYYNRAIVYNKIGHRKEAESDLREASYLGHKKAQELLNGKHAN